MNHQVAVIGAGPYGLSVAAYLPEAQTTVLGEPMGSWRAMPEGMYLKSVWTASSLADPARSYTLDAFAGERRLSPSEPVPLDFFIEYGDWFQRHTGPRVDPAQVRRLSLAGRTYRLELSDGRELVAEKVVVATGIRAFARVPELAKALPPLLASHTGDHRCLSRFRGCTVVVVGAGQSSLETAAILSEMGARVEVISRKPVLWIKRVLYGHSSPISRLLYPPTDVGPPGLNWLNAAPLLMKRLPDGVKGRIEVRSTRPPGAQWLAPRVESRIPITEGVEIAAARPDGNGLRLTLSDATVREVDHLIFGTGYRPDIGKVEFLDATLRTRIAAVDGFPVLNEWFESSVPGLHFVGGLAGRTFGPICRFVAGARIAARQVSRRISELN